MRLSELPRRTAATVLSVQDIGSQDAVARRLRELGFVTGEAVQLITYGPFGKDPMVVQVGNTRFALRRTEAARVEVEVATASVSALANASDAASVPEARRRTA